LDSKKYKIEGHKDKKLGENHEAINQLEYAVKNMEFEETKEEKKIEEPTVDEDGFTLVKKKAKK